MIDSRDLMMLGLCATAAMGQALQNITIEGPSVLITIVQDHFAPNVTNRWIANINGFSNDDYAKVIPDGKFWSMPINPHDVTRSEWIIGSTVDFRMISTSPWVEDVCDAPRSIPSSYGVRAQADQHANWVTLKTNMTIPNQNITGLRSSYDSYSHWLMNAFRVSQTSDLYSDVDNLIGFVHNEDFVQYVQGEMPQECRWKSIAIRYSNDSGKSWTRSVPIVTKGWEDLCMMDHGGCGDVGAYWNSRNQTWHLIFQESVTNDPTSPPLVMAYSSDPWGRPGTWKRYTNGVRDGPGYDINSSFTWDLPNVADVKGSNPSILWDITNQRYQMIYGTWGKVLAYSWSVDGWLWHQPTQFTIPGLAPDIALSYPTLIGDLGDTKANSNYMKLYFKTNETTSFSAAMRMVKVKFWLSGAEDAASDEQIDLNPEVKPEL